jgi:hypothetical protein
MTPYRSIANPARLKATTLTGDELASVGEPVQSAIGTNIAPERGPTQLDLRYCADRTIVTAAGGPDGPAHWSLSGAVSPQDALAHFEANFAPAFAAAPGDVQTSATVEET